MYFLQKDLQFLQHAKSHCERSKDEAGCLFHVGINRIQIITLPKNRDSSVFRSVANHHTHFAIPAHYGILPFLRMLPHGVSKFILSFLF